MVVVERKKVVTSVSNVVKDAKKIDCSVRGVITCAGTLSRKGTSRRQSRHVELTKKRLVREGAMRMLLLQADETGNTSSNGRFKRLSEGSSLKGCAIGTRTEALGRRSNQRTRNSLTEADRTAKTELTN